MIGLSDLRRAWGDFEVRIGSLEIPAGAYAACLGPSGSGKSMLLKLIAGLYRPAAGSIAIGEREVTDLPPERRRVGLVFQEPSLFPHRSVAGNITYGLEARKVPAAERAARLDALVERLRIGPLLRRPVRGLSGGEAQQVALARALATEPEVLLLDEPFNQVDRQARGGLMAALEDIHASGSLTCLHVTHDREEALALGTWIAVLMDGRVLMAGPRDEVLEKPVCAFAARLLGRPDAAGPKPEGCDEECLTGARRCAMLRAQGEGA